MCRKYFAEIEGDMFVILAIEAACKAKILSLKQRVEVAERDTLPARKTALWRTGIAEDKEEIYRLQEILDLLLIWQVKEEKPNTPINITPLLQSLWL